MGPRFPAALPPVPFAAAGKKRHFMDSLCDTDFCRPHSPVPPVARNVLAPDRLRSRFLSPTGPRQNPAICPLTTQNPVEPKLPVALLSRYGSTL